MKYVMTFDPSRNVQNVSPVHIFWCVAAFFVGMAGVTAFSWPLTAMAIKRTLGLFWAINEASACHRSVALLAVHPLPVCVRAWFS